MLAACVCGAVLLGCENAPNPPDGVTLSADGDTARMRVLGGHVKGQGFVPTKDFRSLNTEEIKWLSEHGYECSETETDRLLSDYGAGFKSKGGHEAAMGNFICVRQDQASP